MALRLFSYGPRTFVGPSPNGEAWFSYADRSARPEFALVRDTFEDWFARFPEEAKKDVRGRFRASRDDAHTGAAFEIFCHELLIRLGYRVEVHPAREGDNERVPDFLVRSPDGNDFYLEAVCATEQSTDDVRSKAHKDELVDALNKIDSPSYGLIIHAHGVLQRPIGSAAVRKQVERRVLG